MIISIDPGITNCGVAVMKYDGKTVESLESHNVIGSRKLRDKLALIEERLGARTAKVIRTCTLVKELLIKYPDIKDIVVEGPFYNMKRPNAFEALLDLIHGLKYNVILESDLKLNVIEPTLAKKVFNPLGKAVMGKKGKEAMREHLIKRVKNKELVLPEGREEPSLTEHEVDTHGIGYSYFKCKEIRESKNEKNT